MLYYRKRRKALHYILWIKVRNPLLIFTYFILLLGSFFSVLFFGSFFYSIEPTRLSLLLSCTLSDFYLKPFSFYFHSACDYNCLVVARHQVFFVFLFFTYRSDSRRDMYFTQGGKARFCCGFVLSQSWSCSYGWILYGWIWYGWILCVSCW